MWRLAKKTPQNINIVFNSFGWKGTPDLPGLTQVIRAFQDETDVAALIGDDDNGVLSLSKKERERDGKVSYK